MPNLTIYVPRDLAEKVREYDIAVSKTCQAALARKVRLRERGYQLAVERVQDDGDDSDRGRPA